MSRRRGRAGFSLVEALIAVTLSGIIMTLVMTVFLAQNRFYDDITRRSRVQETVRSVGELVAGDLRAVTRDGVVAAAADSLVVRVPFPIGVSCGAAGGAYHAYLPFGGVPPAAAEVRGTAGREESGDWTYVEASWGALVQAEGSSATVDQCLARGVDTAGVPASDFLTLVPDPGPAGRALMVYTHVTLTFAPSTLRPGARSLYRTVHGSSRVEAATGVSASSGFSYRLAGAGSFAAPVASGDLDRIEAIRVRVEGLEGPGGEATAWGWSFDIPLRNAR